MFHISSSVTRCEIIASKALYSQAFRNEFPWAKEYSTTKHELAINAKDLEFFFCRVCKYSNEIAEMNIVAWLLCKKEHYGYVWHERGLRESVLGRLQHGLKAEDELSLSGSNSEILGYLLCDDVLDKFTSTRSMRDFNDRKIIIEDEYQPLFGMNNRRCFNAFLESPLAKTE